MAVLASIQILKDSMLTDTVLTQDDIQNLIDTLLDNDLTLPKIDAELGGSEWRTHPTGAEIAQAIQDANVSIPAENVSGISDQINAELGSSTWRTGGTGTDGADGLGWTGGSYESTTGIVTFTSDDGLEFSTGDLRGADGADGQDGVTPVKGVDYFDGVDGSDGAQGIQGIQGEKGDQGDQGIQGIQGVAGADGNDGADGSDGLGFTGGSYDEITGVTTFTSDDGLGFSTGDLRGADGQDGSTQTIVNGNWWIDGVDTGVSASGGTGSIITEQSKGLLENDWYNPDFELPVSVTQDALTTSGVYAIDNIAHDFVIAGSSSVVSFIQFDGYNCGRYYTQSSGTFSIDPSFSREYLRGKGYSDGDSMRVGAWVYVSDASVANPVNIILDHLSSFSTALTVDTSGWHWVEIVNDVVITNDPWMKIRFRVSGTSSSWYFRGLTITNITKSQWVGELKSNFLDINRSLPIVNQNPYSRYIFENSPLYDYTYEQDGEVFTKEIIKDEYVNGYTLDVVKTTGIDSTRHRINFFVNNIPVESGWASDAILLNQFRGDSVIKYGFFLKVNADADSYSVTFMNDELRTDTSFRNKWSRQTIFGEYVWYESLPIRLSAGDSKTIESFNIQVDCTPNSGVPEYYAGGVTITNNNNEFSFRPEILNNVAHDTRVYNGIWTSVGDSITLTTNYQYVTNRFLGTEFKFNALGGSTLANNNRTAYVDLNGYPLDSGTYTEPTTGTEGVDYLAINSAMCSDDRLAFIDTNSTLVTIMAGTNDQGQDIPIGSISDPVSNAVGNSFISAAKYWIEYVQTNCPDAIIVNLGTPYRVGESDVINSVNTNGNNAEDFREALDSVFRLYGYTTVDSISGLGVNDSNLSSYSDDGIHPNPQYYVLLGSRFANGIKSIALNEFNYVRNV